MPSKSTMNKQEREWRAEDDYRTITRAAEINADSSRMQGVRQQHRKAQRALTKAGRAIGKGGR